MAEQVVPVSRGKMLWRGLTKKCARCGHGGLFTHWFTMVEDCPNCGLHFEREPGYWVGAVAMNTMAVGVIFVAVLIAFVAATVPDVPWVPLLIIEVAVMGTFPLIFYPYSKTLWVAVDRAYLEHL